MVVAADELPGTTVFGLKVAVAPAGSPVADNVTVPLYVPPTADTVILTLAEPVAATLTGVVGAAMEKVGAELTVKSSTVEVDAAKPVFPEYAAVRLSEPTGRLMVVKVARPEGFTVAAFSRIEPL
jgi:hypothetical protein